MSNNTPPKEIWINLDGMTSYSKEKTEGKTKLNPINGQWYNYDVKYISEHHHNELVAELKAEIEKLKKDENIESIISEIEYIKGLYKNKRYSNAEFSYQKLKQQIKDYIEL